MGHSAVPVGSAGVSSSRPQANGGDVVGGRAPGVGVVWSFLSPVILRTCLPEAGHRGKPVSGTCPGLWESSSQVLGGF